MPDRSKKFHEFALRSILFKGRSDWYFCFLKAERIAHVIAVLSQRGDTSSLKDILRGAQSLPGEIARMAAGEFDAPIVLAEVFALLAGLRLAGTQGFLHADNCAVLVREYELVAEKLVTGSHPSPFIRTEDFFVQELPSEPLPLPSHQSQADSPKETLRDTKDTSNKGHSKGQYKGQNDRAVLILDYIRKHKSASIKEIAATIQGVSEKTVQRELNDLISQGVVKRVGERRWSTYELA